MYIYLFEYLADTTQRWTIIADTINDALHEFFAHISQVRYTIENTDEGSWMICISATDGNYYIGVTEYTRVV